MKWEKYLLKDVTVNLDNRRKPLNEQQRSAISKKKLYPYLGANNVMGYVDEFLFDEEIICIAEDGGSWGANQKCCTHVNERCWVNNHAHVLSANGKADLRFLMYYLNAKDLTPYITGSTRGKLTKSALDSIPIPLPPLAEHKRIAAILDAADALRRKDQQLLQQYDALAQAIFIDMFGDPVKNERGWEKVKLGDVCLKITDGTHFSPPSTSSGVPYVTAKHLKLHHIDFASNPTFISEEHHKEIYARCTPLKGDVLYIKDGATTGVAAVNEFDFEFSMLSSLALIKPNKSHLNPYFLSFYLNMPAVKNELTRNYMAGAAIKRFTLDKINKFEILTPPVDLQDDFEKVWRQIRISYTLLKESKSSDLFHSLLQQAFRGELSA
jgi:type I restriction enzyme S subunit